ncbi:MAG: LysM peptidoglycan-binding domain-containing protein, partial [Acidimicrobiales bacterium]
ISKWKRFKNTLKAFGKAWVQGWKDNPWKALFDTAKIVASVVATVFPPTSGAGLAALTVLAADTAVSIADGDVLGALSSAFGAVGGAAGYFGNVAVAGSTASVVSQGATIGKNVVDGIEAVDGVIDGIENGDILSAVGSGFGLLGNAANIVSTGTNVLGEVGGVIADGTVKTIVDTGSEIAQTATQLQGITDGLGNTIRAAEDGNILGAVVGGIGVAGRGLQAVTDDSGILDDGLGLTEDFEGGLAKVGNTLVDVSEAGFTGSATIDAIQNDDLVGALSNGFRFAGDAATIVGNRNGVVGSTFGVGGDTARQLTNFGRTGSRQLAELTELGGAAAEGDVLRIIENTIDLGQLSAEQKSRLAGQLTAADSVLDVAKVVESVYDGGDVDLDKLYGEIDEALKDIREIPVELEPVPLPEPVNPDPLLDSDGDFIPDHLDLQPLVPNGNGNGPLPFAPELGGPEPNFQLLEDVTVTEVPIGGGQTVYRIQDAKNGIVFEGTGTKHGDRIYFGGNTTIAGQDGFATGYFSESTGGFSYSVTDRAGNPLVELAQKPIRPGVSELDFKIQGEDAFDPGAGLALPFAAGGVAAPDLGFTETGPLVEIQDGQTLSEIAQSNGVTVDEILELNPDIVDPDRVQIGQAISLPTNARSTFQPSPARPQDLDPSLRDRGIDRGIGQGGPGSEVFGQGVGQGGPLVEPGRKPNQPFTQEERLKSLLSPPGRPRQEWQIEANPDATGEAPWHAVTLIGREAVLNNDAAIERSARRHGVDPDVLRSIVYVENSQGYYDDLHYVIPDAIAERQTFRPMNINHEDFAGLGADADRLFNDPDHNIDIGAQIVRRLGERIIDPTIEKVATAYNSLPKDQVTDYGKRVAKVYEEKPWLDPHFDGPPHGLGPINPN